MCGETACDWGRPRARLTLMLPFLGIDHVNHHAPYQLGRDRRFCICHIMMIGGMLMIEAGVLCRVWAKQVTCSCSCPGMAVVGPKAGLAIPGMGHFVVANRKARTRRNPQTGETVTIPRSEDRAVQGQQVHPKNHACGKVSRLALRRQTHQELESGNAFREVEAPWYQQHPT
jgi:Bacterial DNA-binding protein